MTTDQDKGNQPPETDAAEPQTKSARAGRSKPVVAIELPATAISEEKTPAGAAASGAGEPDAAPASEPVAGVEALSVDPPKPQPVRSPKLVPALLGLIAGAIGGAGAWVSMERFGPAKPDLKIEQRLVAIEAAATKAVAPAVPAGLIERLAKAEAALATAAEREKALKGEIETLAAAVRSESEARSKAVALFTGQDGTPRPPAQVVIPTPEAKEEIEKLRARLGTVEGTANALPGAIGAVAAKADSVVTRVEAIAPRVDQMTIRVEALAPKIETVGKDVATLAKTVSGLGTRDALARAAGFVAAAGVLEERFKNGQPLGQATQTLRSLGIAEARLAMFAPYATAGAPSLADLRAELRAIRPVSTTGATKSGDLLQRLKEGALSLVEIRRTGQVTGTDDPSQLAIAEQALARGDLAAALAAVGRLSAERAPAYSAWRQKAEQRQKAAQGVSDLSAEAFGALAAATGAPKQ